MSIELVVIIVIICLTYSLTVLGLLFASIMDNVAFVNEPLGVKILESVLFPITGVFLLIKFARKYIPNVLNFIIKLNLNAIGVALNCFYLKVKSDLVGFYLNKLKILEE